MTGPPNKRQKREAYQKAQEAALQSTATADKNGSNGKTSSKKVELPKKKFYRQRAHANPFSDHALIYPDSPDNMDWSLHYPYFTADLENSSEETFSDVQPRSKKQVEIADIGCGFGGLLIALSPVFPDTLMLGMELRNQVLSYVTSRISALRAQNLPSPTSTSDTPPPYSNISALRTNSMKFLPQYFPKASLSKIFLCFPDPHFKQRKHKARIVSRSLCAEYAYVLKRGSGLVYTITDVEELSLWMAKCFDGPKRKLVVDEGQEGDEEQVEDEEDEGDDMGAVAGVEELFERVPEEELATDPCVRIMSEETEEAKKVTRNGGKKFIYVWRRKDDPEWP